MEEMPDSFLIDQRFSADEAAKVENVLANLREAFENGNAKFAGVEIKGIEYNKDTGTITITNYEEFRKTLLGDNLDGETSGLYWHADTVTAKPESMPHLY